MKFTGYHEVEDLPIKRGDTVTIRKNVTIHSTKGEPKICGRTYKVRVDHVLPGVSYTELVWDEATKTCKKVMTAKSNPSVRWAGSGGY